MKETILISLEVLDWMPTCRLGEYLKSIRYLRQPEFLLWKDIIKTHKGSSRYAIKEDDILYAYKEMVTENLDTDYLFEYFAEVYALLSIPSECFDFFETTIWRKIFDEMFKRRQNLGVESNFIIIYDVPEFPYSGKEQFNLQEFYEYLDSWLLFQCLGSVSITDKEGKKYYSLEIKLD